MAPLGKHRQSLGVPRMKSGELDTTTPGEKPPTTLKLWIIRIQTGGVVVEGYKQVSDKDATTLLNWRSTPIARRLDAKTLQTHSGSIYKLKGGIDEDEAVEAGIPMEIVERFALGFPEDWQEIVDEVIEQQQAARRRQSIQKETTGEEKREEQRENEKEKEERTGGGKGKKAVLQLDNTMNNGETSDQEEEEEEEERHKDAKQRRSIQKSRKSLMHRVQHDATIEEEEEEEEEEEKEVEEKTPAKGKTPRGKTPSTTTRNGEKKTPAGRARGGEEKEKEKEEEAVPAAPSTSRASRTPRGEKKTPKGRGKEKEDEEEVFATPDERPPRGRTNSMDNRALSVVPIQPQQEKRREEQQEQQPQASSSTRPRRYSLKEIPREIMEKSIPLSHWVIRFVKGGNDKSIFPHFQFKCCGFRPESQEDEWSTSVVQKVVPPYILFTSSSIYRLDGQMDVKMATDMGFPSNFITDFLLGFPDEWEDLLETFFNKTFGPPPQPRIVELMSDGGTADEGVEKKKEEERVKRDFDTPRNEIGQKIRANGLRFPPQTPVENRKRKEPTPSSASDGSRATSEGEEDDSEDEEEALRREARKVEKQMRREEKRAQKEAELKAKAKKAKQERFEVKVNRTPDGVPVSRSGRTLRTPLATWAGEKITYDVRGNAVSVSGVTTTTKLTVGKTNPNQTDMLATHFGLDSPLNTANQKEKAIAPPAAERPKTPVPRKSRADLKGYSDDETDRIDFEAYKRMLAAQAEATPAFILKKGKRRCNRVDSSDSEAEAEERRKEEKRRKREERRRLRESEEEESSDDGWRRKKKTTKSKKKVVAVKKEKPVKPVPARAASKKRAPSKKRSEESEEEEVDGDRWGEDFSEIHIEHDDDAVTFVPSEEGSNPRRGNGYSDDDMNLSEPDEPAKIEKKSKKAPAKRTKVWKKEELTRLKLAIQAADPKGIPDGWANVAKSIGGDRTAEECKKTAREQLKMKVDESEEEVDEGEEERGWSGAESGAASEDEEKKKRRKGKMDGPGIAGVTAKKGTIAYAVEMENKKREMLMGGGASQEDFFKGTNVELAEAEALPSVAVFDPDDSLLELLGDSPQPAGPKARTTKTAKLAAAAVTPRLSQLSSYDDSPASSNRRSSSKFIPSPVVNQNDLTRYVHHLSRSRLAGGGNMSMLSKSMADRSRMLPPQLPRGRQIEKAAEAIDKVENTLRMRARRRNDMEDLDEDDDEENNDDNILPAGF